jgi:hypothetical protein
MTDMTERAPIWLWIVVAVTVIALGWRLTRRVQRTRQRVFLRSVAIAWALAPTAIPISGRVVTGWVIFPAWQAVLAGAFDTSIFFLVFGLVPVALATVFLWSAGMMLYE